MRRIALCGLAALILLSGCKRDISGMYLVNDKVAVCWLQLVRTPDNHLTGQLIGSVLKSDGQVERSSVALTGAVDGENVSLTGGGFLGLSTTTFSGTLEGDSLTLTGVQPTPITFKRASLAEYQAQIGGQNNRAQAILSERAAAASRKRTFQEQKNFLAGIYELINRMQRFDADADVHLGWFPKAEKRYEAITAKIEEYVARERQLAGKPDRAVDRSQLAVDATQVSLDTDQMHFDAQSLQSSLQMNIAPLASEEATMEQTCNENGSVSSNLTPAQIDERKPACSRLLGVAALFRQKYSAMSAGLSHLEEVYAREKKAQGSLLSTAQKLE